MQSVRLLTLNSILPRLVDNAAAFSLTSRESRGTGNERKIPLDEQFEIASIKTKDERAVISGDWARMMGASPSPEKMYLSPEFFSYLLETGDPHLFAVRRRSDGMIVGILPVRERELQLEFRAGRFGSLRARLRTVQLLGSIPMLEDQPGLLDWACRRVLARFPDARALSMQAVPQELAGRFGDLARLRARVVDGWRECHTIPVPASFDEYLHKFSAKKRYNLGRQVKLLVKEAGKLEVTRIERPGQVGLLMEAVAALASARDFAAFPERSRFERLAAHGLLLSYVVTCGGEPVGAIVATNGGDKWHVHNIFSAAKYHHLSAGTSALHVALEDVMNNFSFGEADFGYGTPNRDFRSTHLLRTRGHVLLYRPGGPTAVLVACHCWYGRLYDGLASRVKQWRRRLGASRKRLPAA
jgi:hypothetical protein